MQIDNKFLAQVNSFFWSIGLTHVLMLTRDVLVARSYGLSEDLDSWMLIFGGATFVVASLSSGLSAYLVPRLQRYLLLEQWPAAAIAEFKKKVFRNLLFALGLLAIVQELLLVLKFDRSPLAFIFCGLIVAMLTFQIVFLRAQLQAKMNVIGVSMAPSISIFVSAVVVVFGVPWLGIYALIFGIILGLSLELLTVHRLLAGSNSNLKHLEQVSIEEAADVWMYWQLVGAAALQGATLVLDQMMIASLHGEGVAAFAYGSKATGAVVGVLGGLLQVIVFPNVARDFVARRFFSNVKKKVLIVSSVSVLTAGILYLIANPLVELLFMGGKTSQADALVIADLHKIFVLQLPFYLLCSMGQQMLQILGKGKTMLLITGLGLMVKLVMNFSLHEVLGLKCFAWSTVALYAFNFVLIWGLFIYHRKRVSLIRKI